MVKVEKDYGAFRDPIRRETHEFEPRAWRRAFWGWLLAFAVATGAAYVVVERVL